MRSRRAVLYICSALASITFNLHGQVKPATAPNVAVAVRTGHPPRLDGTLNDPLWSAAPVVGGFRQKEPLETQPATEKTEVRILFDSRTFILGSTARRTRRRALLPMNCDVT